MQKENGDGYKYLCLETGDYSIETDYEAWNYSKEYILYDNQDKKLYSYLTGELIASGFDDFKYAYGYLYIIKNDKVTVYKQK